MSESLSEQKSSEQRVFGDAFSFSKGMSDERTQQKFFEERVRLVSQGEIIWLPRTLDEEGGVAADLYGTREIVATLNFDYDTHSASVYVTSEGGKYGDTVLSDRVTFDEAVVEAEKFAAELLLSQ